MTGSTAPTIFLTGATGWLGSALAKATVEGTPALPEPVARGSRLVCLVAPGDDTQRLRTLGAEIVTGDIRDRAACAEFLKSGEGGILIHVAGVIHPRRIRDFDEINTAGTLNLLEAARANGLHRMVVMSSNSPLGCNPRPDHLFDEESPYNPYMGYGRSKHHMEVALRGEIEGGKGPEIVIVRAPWFYGPGQPARQTRFFSLIRQGKFPIIGSGENRRSMAYIGNLAQGLLLATKHQAAAGRTYWIADRTPYSMNEIVATVRSVLKDDFGLTVVDRTIRLPGLLSEFAYIADGLIQRTGLYNQEIHVLSEMNKTIACRIGRAEQELGYAPTIVLREGMRRSIAWCLENGHRI